MKELKFNTEIWWYLLHFMVGQQQNNQLYGVKLHCNEDVILDKEFIYMS